jgi:NAD-dependent deacetylase
MTKISNIVILTGAGISAESGLATFRADDGLWENHRVEDVATPEAFVRDPVLVHHFYDARRANLATVEPNAAHEALARLDAEWPGELLIVTQNVDDRPACRLCPGRCDADHLALRGVRLHDPLVAARSGL